MPTKNPLGHIFSWLQIERLSHQETFRLPNFSYWQSAQKRLKRALGTGNWSTMIDALMYAAEAAR